MANWILFAVLPIKMNIFFINIFLYWSKCFFKTHSKRQDFPPPVFLQIVPNAHLGCSCTFYFSKQWWHFVSSAEKSIGMNEKNHLPSCWAKIVISFEFICILSTRDVNIFVVFLSSEMLFCELVHTVYTLSLLILDWCIIAHMPGLIVLTRISSHIRLLLLKNGFM